MKKQTLQSMIVFGSTATAVGILLASNSTSNPYSYTATVATYIDMNRKLETLKKNTRTLQRSSADKKAQELDDHINLEEENINEYRIENLEIIKAYENREILNNIALPVGIIASTSGLLSATLGGITLVAKRKRNYS